MQTPRDPKGSNDPATNDTVSEKEGPWSEAPTRVSRGPLVPCPSCKRHVFASIEATCPFCRAALPVDLAQRAAPSTTRRMSRGEMFSFNALRAVAGGLGLQSAPAPAPAAEPGSHYGTGLGFGSPFNEDPGSTYAMYGAPAPGIELGPHEDDPGSSFAMYGAPADPGSEWTNPAPGEENPGEDGAGHDTWDTRNATHDEYSAGFDSSEAYAGANDEYSAGFDGGDYGGDYGEDYGASGSDGGDSMEA